MYLLKNKLAQIPLHKSNGRNSPALPIPIQHQHHHPIILTSTPTHLLSICSLKRNNFLTTTYHFKENPRQCIPDSSIPYHKNLYHNLINKKRYSCSILCSFDINRGSSLVVTHSTADVRLTSDRPGTP